MLKNSHNRIFRYGVRGIFISLCGLCIAIFILILFFFSFIFPIKFGKYLMSIEYVDAYDDYSNGNVFF